MSDQWKAKVTTIAGKPVALVDVTITRTMMVDAEVFDRFQSVLEDQTDGEPSGLAEVGQFYRLIDQLSPDARRFITVNWTDAEGKKIGLKPISELISFFDDKAYWRIEGSAEKGFTGYFNFGAQDKGIDLSEAKLQDFNDKLKKTKEDALQAFAEGKITQAEQDAIDELCNEAGRSSYACEMAYRAFAERQRIRDEQERRNRERLDRQNELNIIEGSQRTGDFPADFGRDFDNVG